jgi:DNA-3-methyladenine glycosylase I
VADLVPGDDGLLRCGWGASTAEYAAYHDLEWGRPVTDDLRLFEKLCLEAFQSGLSWLTILRKRPAFRSAFAGFDPPRVARFGPDDVERLLADAGIVRNRAKIEATIANARAVVDLWDRGRTLAGLVWAHEPPATGPPRTMADVPAATAQSASLARALKATGFRFLGPTTCYAAMQALGLVDDHLEGCHARAACEAERDALDRPT